MTCPPRVPPTASARPQAAQQVHDDSWPMRERSWALKGLAVFIHADVARLLAQSAELVTRSESLRAAAHLAHGRLLPGAL